MCTSIISVYHITGNYIQWALFMYFHLKLQCMCLRPLGEYKFSDVLQLIERLFRWFQAHSVQCIMLVILCLSGEQWNSTRQSAVLAARIASVTLMLRLTYGGKLWVLRFRRSFVRNTMSAVFPYARMTKSRLFFSTSVCFICISCESDNLACPVYKVQINEKWRQWLHAHDSWLLI